MSLQLTPEIYGDFKTVSTGRLECAVQTKNFLEETGSDSDMEGLPDLVTPEVYSHRMAERAREFKPLLGSGNTIYTWRNARVHILLDLKSDKDCIAIAFDCQQAVVNGEPPNSDGYPSDDISYHVVAGADPAVPVRGVPNRISTWKNNKAFKMILDRVSESIQQAILAHTDMATKAFRFLDSLYSEQAGARELTTVTSLYALTMSGHETLQTYLSRAYDLYSQLPQIQGTSICSVPTFLSLIVKGLNSRPEYDGYINQFNPDEVTTFSILQTKMNHWCLVKNVDPAPSPEESELAAAAYRYRRPSNANTRVLQRDRRDINKKMTCWNCGGVGHSSRECISEDTDLAFKPVDSDGSDNGSKSPPKETSGDDKDSDKKKSSSRWRKNFLEETDSDSDMEGLPDLVAPEVYSHRMAERAREFKPLSEDQQVGDPPDIPTISPATQQRHLLRIISPTPDLPDHLNNLTLQQARAEMELLSDQIRTNYEEYDGPIDGSQLPGSTTKVASPQGVDGAISHLSSLFDSLGRSGPYDDATGVGNPCLSSYPIKNYRRGYHQIIWAAGYQESSAVPMTEAKVEAVVTHLNQAALEAPDSWTKLIHLRDALVILHAWKTAYGGTAESGKLCLLDLHTSDKLRLPTHGTKTNKRSRCHQVPVEYQLMDQPEFCFLRHLWDFMALCYRTGMPVQHYILRPLTPNHKGFKEAPYSGSTTTKRIEKYLQELSLFTGETSHSLRRGSLQAVAQLSGVAAAAQHGMAVSRHLQC
eukprot:gene97-biopygen3398